MIKPLPHWVLTNEYPAFYDTESVTAIEMVAKLYGSMEELITDYNHFVDEINSTIQDFEDGLIGDFNDFKDLINQTVADFIALVDDKIDAQDEVIADAVQYMKDNIQETASELFNEFLQTGQIYVSLATDYDENDESLILGIDALPSEELLEDLSELATVEDGD